MLPVAEDVRFEFHPLFFLPAGLNAGRLAFRRWLIRRSLRRTRAPIFLTLPPPEEIWRNPRVIASFEGVTFQPHEAEAGV